MRSAVWRLTYFVMKLSVSQLLPDCSSPPMFLWSSSSWTTVQYTWIFLDGFKTALSVNIFLWWKIPDASKKVLYPFLSIAIYSRQIRAGLFPAIGNWCSLSPSQWGNLENAGMSFLSLGLFLTHYFWHRLWKRKTRKWEFLICKMLRGWALLSLWCIVCFALKSVSVLLAVI